MIIARVIGSVLATHKDKELTGYRLVVIRSVDPENNDNETNDVFVAIDTLGAGVGELVLVTQGSIASKAVENKVPADAAVVALVDKLEISKM